jgi:short-subunit dehydrogenase
MKEYAGRTVVVTGAGSGLGAAMADVFAGAGAALALLDIDAARVEAKAADLRDGGAEAVAIPADVADAGALSAAAQEVRRRFGACHVLCANVGVQQLGAADRLTAQDWTWVLQVNVLGVIGTVSAFLPLLRQGAGRRHVLLTASSSVLRPMVRLAAYVASKQAVVGYGEVLRRELAPEGVNVTLLFPAGMSTRHLESSRLARPASLGESVLDRADMAAMVADAGAGHADHVASAEHAVRNLLAELRDNRPYVFTHGGYRDDIVRHHDEILAAYDRMAAS